MGPMMITWPVLLGQAVEVSGGVTPSGIPLVVMLIPITLLALIILVPVVLGIRSEQHRRELKHAERMRAIELGRPLPGVGGWWSPGWIAAGIGIGVPIVVFGIGFKASIDVESAAPFIWPSAGGVGLAAVICGTVLAARSMALRPAAPEPPAKPYVHPDAYDAAEHQHA